MDADLITLITGGVGGGLGYAIGQVVQFFLGRKAQKAQLALQEQNAYAQMAQRDEEQILQLHDRLRRVEKAIYIAHSCKFAYQCPTLKAIDQERRMHHYPRDSEATLNADEDTPEEPQP